MPTYLSEDTIQSNGRILSLQGLSESEVMERRTKGEGNMAALKTSRSYLQIVRKNVFTSIDTILFVLGITLIMLGQISDALVSVSVVFVNVLVSIVQEIRAKRTLDRIALLTRPQAVVMRDGRERMIDPGEIVVGDLLVVRPGESKLHPRVAARLLHEMRQQAQSPLKDMTPRELEVLSRIARGRSNTEIAAELVISEPTVRMHVANILSKLHLADRTQAAIYALQQRIVPLSDALEES